MEKKLVVAIDGPAGAGKSTIAKLAAEELDYIYIDTGAMYRSVAWKFLQSKQDFSPELVSKLAAEMTITFKQEAKLNRVFVDGLEVTDEIRTPEVTEIVSKVSAVGAVREAMVAQQRCMGEAGGVVMDGRDIGTVVFPHADLKIFLTASAEERASRRYKEMLAKGMQAAGASLRGRGGVRYIYYLENDQKQLVESTHTEVRAERSFTLLEDVNCPAVLAEQCFVTNEADVAQFGSEEGCKKTARVYYEAICAYFGTQPQAEQLAGFTLN